MMEKKKILILTVLILILSAYIYLRYVYIEPDVKNVNLGRQYYYIPFRETTFDVSTFQGNGIYRNFSYDNNPFISVIFPQIVRYAFDSSFIIVQQKFDIIQTSIFLRWIIQSNSSYFGYQRGVTPFDSSLLFKASKDYIDTMQDPNIYFDSIVRLDSNIISMSKLDTCYYIINKKEHKTMGPYSKEIFAKRRKDLDVLLKFE